MKIVIYDDKKEKSGSFEARLKIADHEPLEFPMIGFGSNSEQAIDELRSLIKFKIDKLEKFLEELKTFDQSYTFGYEIIEHSATYQDRNFLTT